jgi:hypothetical protein
MAVLCHCRAKQKSEAMMTLRTSPVGAHRAPPDSRPDHASGLAGHRAAKQDRALLVGSGLRELPAHRPRRRRVRDVR